MPSRFGRHVDVHKPFVGQRIVVKDIFDIRGLQTSACNRAFLRWNRPADQTAPIIQRLIDGGAEIVGKAKLSSMISREEPSENLEYHPPHNPRGDGEQSPAGSSSGSAAAVAAYDWLDFGIGSDCMTAVCLRVSMLTLSSYREFKAASHGQWRVRLAPFNRCPSYHRHDAMLSVSATHL